EIRLVVLREAAREDFDDVLVMDALMERGLALEHRSPFGVGHEMRQEPLHDELSRARLRIDRMREINLRRAADGQPRIEPIRTESHGSAAQRPRHPTPRRVFAWHRAQKCIYVWLEKRQNDA